MLFLTVQSEHWNYYFLMKPSYFIAPLQRPKSAKVIAFNCRPVVTTAHGSVKNRRYHTRHRLKLLFSYEGQLRICRVFRLFCIKYIFLNCTKYNYKYNYKKLAESYVPLRTQDLYDDCRYNLMKNWNSFMLKIERD